MIAALVKQIKYYNFILSFSLLCGIEKITLIYVCSHQISTCKSHRILEVCKNLHLCFEYKLVEIDNSSHDIYDYIVQNQCSGNDFSQM